MSHCARLSHDAVRRRLPVLHSLPVVIGDIFSVVPDPFHHAVVIVTGASSGIGREIALQLADRGARLVLGARSRKRLDAVCRDSRVRHQEVLVVPTDVTEAVQCERLVAATVDRFGRLDALVNNAGITMAFRFDELGDLTLPERLIRVNYLGSVYCTHYGLPHLKRSGGRIIGIGSLTGKTGVPLRSLYAASKHAMAGFFDSLRIELAQTGVSVTMIYPDFVQTEVRNRALGPDGDPVGITQPSDGTFMTAAECARIVIRAGAARKREAILSARGKMGLLLKAFAPGFVDRIAQKAMERVRLTRTSPDDVTPRWRT